MERMSLNAIAEKMRNELMKAHECLVNNVVKPCETLVYGPDGEIKVIKVSETFPLPTPCMQ